MRLRHELLVCLGVLWGLHLLLPARFASASESAPTQDELLTLVIGRTKQNYALIQRGDVLVDVAIANPKPDGTIAHVRLQEHVQFSGKRIRYEQLLEDRTPYIIAYADDVWREFTMAARPKTPDDNRLTISRNERLPDMVPFDPREYAVEGSRESLASVLTSDTIDEARLVDRGSGRMIVEMSRKLRKKPYEGWERVYTFDSNVSYLPTLVLIRDATGNVRRSLEIEYQQVLDGKAFLPKNRVLKIYSSIKGLKSAEDSRWVQRHTKTVVRVILDQPIEDDRFKTVEVPDGTTVDDQIRGRLYLSSMEIPTTNKTDISPRSN